MDMSLIYIVIGACGALLLVGWPAFFYWTWRLSHPSPSASHYITIETERDAFQEMLHVQGQASRLLCKEVCELRAQVAQLLGAQAMLCNI